METNMKTTYTIDPAHSGAHFSVRHMMVTNVRGGFKKVTGKVVFDAENPANSSVEAEIDAASITTNDDQRDAHLRSGDFLDVEHFPTITFRSTNIEPNGDGEWKVTGDLTIHGVTRPVVLKVEGPGADTKDPWGNLRTGASSTTKIKRSDFGLTWNAALETGGLLVGDDLKIELELSLLKSADVSKAA
jgi:polyisoprenoid-binding protein YceI